MVSSVMKRYLLFLVFFFLIGKICLSQKQSVSVDTVHIQLLIDSCRNAIGTNALIIGQNTLDRIKSIFPAADEKTKRFLKISEASLLRIMGNVYKNHFSDFPKALEYYKKCMEISKEANDKVNWGGVLMNSGIIYSELHQYERASDYLKRGLKMFIEANSRRGIAFCFQSIGGLYTILRQDSLALSFYEQSFQIFTELNEKSNASLQLNNIANIYKIQGKLKEALDNYRVALKMSEETGDSANVAICLAGIGEILEKTNKTKEAERNYLRALPNATLEIKMQIFNALKDMYNKQKRYEDAFKMYDRYILTKDSLFKQHNAEEIEKNRMRTDFEEQQARLKAEREKEAAIAEEKDKRQRTIIWSIAAGLFLVVVFSVFILNRWRVTQNQKKIIEIQKAEVEKQRELAENRRIIAEEQNKIIEKSKQIIEQHNKDITDSIHYASRIQRALLTSDEYIGRYLKDFFILFRPKDIVSGDFYWAFSPSESSDKQTFFIACCDCTGHGVPGAFMSLLNISFLNEALIEKKLRDTDQILNDVRSNVIRALNPDGKSEAKDGMDAVLCAIDFKNNLLHASCANNPVWLLQNGKINEIAPDKMPVGLHSTMNPFKKNTTQLNKNDIIYIFTDGYADQFGGPKGKKFKYRQLEEVLLANHHLPMNEQKDILDKTYNNWKGDLEQVDDVLVIGIKV